MLVRMRMQDIFFRMLKCVVITALLICRALGQVTVTDVTCNGFTISPNDSNYNVTISARNIFNNHGRLFNNNLQHYKVTGLKGNVIYNVSIQNLETKAQTRFIVRTAPNGANITHSYTTPFYAVLFLEPVTGAYQWEVEYTNLATGQTFTMSTPTEEPMSTFYVAVINDLSPNTLYAARARVSKLLSTTLTSIQSPFGPKTNFSTEMVSAFGRVHLRNKSYSFTQINQILEKKYSTVSNVGKVMVLSKTNYTVHFELRLKLTSEPTTAEINSLILVDSANFEGMVVHYNESHGGGYALQSDKGVPTLMATTLTCGRIGELHWKIHSSKGNVTDAILPISNDRNLGTVYDINMTDEGIAVWSQSLFRFENNEVYAIEQDYLIQVCVPTHNESEGNLVYDRVYSASNTGNKNYVIIYTTGPENLNDPISSYKLATDDQTAEESFVVFTVQNVQRACTYSFVLTNATGTTIDSLILNEDELDASPTFQVTTGVALAVNKSYSLLLKVTTRLANGTLSSSDVFRYSFVTELPVFTTHVSSDTTDSYTQHEEFHSIIQDTDTTSTDQLQSETSSRDLSTPVATTHAADNTASESTAAEPFPMTNSNPLGRLRAPDIIGIVIGVLVTIAVIVGVSVWRIRKSRYSKSVV